MPAGPLDYVDQPPTLSIQSHGSWTVDGVILSNSIYVLLCKRRSKIGSVSDHLLDGDHFTELTLIYGLP